MNERMYISGKCGTCGDSLEVKGDDNAVMACWSEFRKLHSHNDVNTAGKRLGVILVCGCWYFAQPGSRAGKDYGECPNGHGWLRIDRCNVYEGNQT